MAPECGLYVPHTRDGNLPSRRGRGGGLWARGRIPLYERLKPPTVRIVQPEVRKIVRNVGQPSFIEAYERTSIYAKLTGYIDKWIVDIGDKVKKGEVLAKLFVPELVEDFRTKKATVKLDEERVLLARKLVDVSEADVKAPEAQLIEAKAILAKYKLRWTAGTRRSSGSRTRSTGAWSTSDPQRVDQPVEIECRVAKRRQGDHFEGRGRVALQAGDSCQGKDRCFRRPG